MAVDQKKTITTRRRRVSFDQKPAKVIPVKKTDGDNNTLNPDDDGSSNRVLLFLLFLFVLTILAVAYDPKWQRIIWGESNRKGGLKWWQSSIVYQIYPRSFQDSDGDGIGDINGIIARLDYFEHLRVEAIWLSPIYKSPMVDFGYDVSDFTDVDPMFGTMKDFNRLIKKAHQKGIKVIMDFIPNHTSDKHQWFLQSKLGGENNKYADYYVWQDGKVLENGTRVPPNNWISVFGGSMWEWDNTRKQYYLHQFTKEQPDLNFRNNKVHEEIKNVFKFWLNRGVDGFRVDALRHMYEVNDMSLDEPRSFVLGTTPDQYEYYDHPHTVNLPEVHPVIGRWRKLFQEFEDKFDKHIFMVVEIYGDDNNMQMPYYHSGADMPFNFNLLMANNTCAGKCMARLVGKWMRAMPIGKWPNWVTGNHDTPRISYKMGPNLVNAMNMLLLLLPGTPTTYYGEELGLRAITVSYNDTQDPHGRNFGPERYSEFSRDPCRAPMQWSSEENAGFSTAVKTWLPVHGDYKTNNVEAQMGDPSSVLELYRTLAKLRKEKSFMIGGYDKAIVNNDIFSFIRFKEKNVAYLVAINFGTQSSSDNYRKYEGLFPPAGKFVSNKGYVVANTNNFDAGSELRKDNIVQLNGITLHPGQGVVIRFWPGY